MEATCGLNFQIHFSWSELRLSSRRFTWSLSNVWPQLHAQCLKVTPTVSSGTRPLLQDQFLLVFNQLRFRKICPSWSFISCHDIYFIIFCLQVCFKLFPGSGVWRSKSVPTSRRTNSAAARSFCTLSSCS